MTETRTDGHSPAAALPLAVLATVAGVWALVAAREFLVPLVLAVLAFVLVQALDRFWMRLRVGAHRLPPAASTLLSALLIVGLGVGAAQLVAENAVGVAEAAPGYERRFRELAADVEAWLQRGAPAEGSETLPGSDAEGPADADGEVTELVDRLLDQVDVAGLAGRVASSVASIVGNLALVLVYLLFLLLERPFFEAKLRAMVGDPSRRGDLREILRRIGQDVGAYLGLKTLVSLMTALPSYAILRVLGVDFAEFWALLLFALNFIPNVGSLLATVLPSVIALLQFETLRPFWIVAISITAIQIFVANVIEPSLLGRRLNMSPLVVILALVAWSLLWGIPGAFLCIPMTTILLIVLANVDSTRWIAVLLSRDGDVHEATVDPRD